MLKKTITYEDWNGNTRTEDFYFNLKKVECTELEYSLGPGMTLSESFQTLIETQDFAAIIKVIKDMLFKSYGIKSDDGKRFMKSAEISKAFEESPVFDDIYMELVSDAKKAADFMTALVPKDLVSQLGDNPSQELLNRVDNLKLMN